jgi:DNA-binding CsgD family transcriptional regulator
MPAPFEAGMAFDPIAVIEACYAAIPDRDSWLRSLAGTLAPLAEGSAAYAQRFDATDPSRLQVTSMASGADVPEEVLFPAWKAAPPGLVAAIFAPRPVIDLLSRRARALQSDTSGLLCAWREGRNRHEAVAVIASERERCGHVLGFVQRRGYRPPARLLHSLGCIAAHLVSAARLRCLLDSFGGDPADGADAVLDPAGRLHHAVGDAGAAEARDHLEAAVRRLEKARGALRRSDPEAALALWRDLVDGRWSVVDHVEADGRRWVLARRNAPGDGDPKALTRRERDVAAGAALGRANKLIAYQLGVAPSTVSDPLESALRKLRLASREELIAFFRGAGRPEAGP